MTRSMIGKDGFVFRAAFLHICSVAKPTKKSKAPATHNKTDSIKTSASTLCVEYRSCDALSLTGRAGRLCRLPASGLVHRGSKRKHAGALHEQPRAAPGRGVLLRTAEKAGPRSLRPRRARQPGIPIIVAPAGAVVIVAPTVARGCVHRRRRRGHAAQTATATTTAGAGAQPATAWAQPATRWRVAGA